MQKLTLTLSFIILAVLSVSGQKNKPDDAISTTSFYAELGGPGILFSANIDKRFTQSHLGWGGRIGIGFISGFLTDDPFNSNYNPSSVVTVPVQINYIFGKKNSPHSFEAGAGVTVAGKKIDIFDFYNGRRSNFFATASFMYRRQPMNGGFSWRIGFTPLIAQGYIQPSGGVSVGYNF